MDICRHRRISATFQLPWQHYKIIQREKDHGLITTILAIKAMRRTAQKLNELVDMSRVRGAVI